MHAEEIAKTSSKGPEEAGDADAEGDGLRGGAKRNATAGRLALDVAGANGLDGLSGGRTCGDGALQMARDGLMSRTDVEGRLLPLLLWPRDLAALRCATRGRRTRAAHFLHLTASSFPAGSEAHRVTQMPASPHAPRGGSFHPTCPIDLSRSFLTPSVRLRFAPYHSHPSVPSPFACADRSRARRTVP